MVFLLALTAPTLAAVRAGDQLQVTVYNDPDLSSKVTVDSAGRVWMPLAGGVTVQGLEAAQAATQIERALDPYFRNRASVSVAMVAQTASLFVSGGPGGVLKYEPGETLTAALSDLSGTQAPGSTATGVKSSGLVTLARSRVDLRAVSIDRDGATLGPFDALALSARGESGPELQPGDTISLVNKPNRVRVLGDVASPGSTYVSGDETLNDAIAQAGGVLDTAASANITLTRGGVTTSLALGANQLSEPAHDGDIVTIPTAPRVSVVGTVVKPGIVALKTNFTLLNALYEAGGPARRADLAHVQVTHNGTVADYNLANLTHGDLSQNPVLADGDLVMLPESRGVDFSAVFQYLVPFIYLLPRY